MIKTSIFQYKKLTINMRKDFRFHRVHDTAEEPSNLFLNYNKMMNVY